MEELAGRQFGPYRVVAPLGQGGMASVYKAFQPAVNRYVALKVLSHYFTTDEASRAQFFHRFRHEAAILAQLQHPHILPVFDFGESDGYAFLAMPLIDGGTLTGLLKGRPLSFDVVERVVRQVGDALDYAHSSGIVHRDIKPSNILLDGRGNCLLADFGLARMTEDATRLTVTGAIMGTPQYMSPEQASGESIGPATDIYSLGVVLYEMLTGRVPFQAETPIAVAMKVVSAPLPPPGSFNPGLIPEMEAVVLKALARDASDRFSSAAEMGRNLASAIIASHQFQSTKTFVDVLPAAQEPQQSSSAPSQDALETGVVPVNVPSVPTALGTASNTSHNQTSHAGHTRQPTSDGEVEAAPHQIVKSVVGDVLSVPKPIFPESVRPERTDFTPEQVLQHQIPEVEPPLDENRRPKSHRQVAATVIQAAEVVATENRARPTRMSPSLRKKLAWISLSGIVILSLAAIREFVAVSRFREMEKVGSYRSFRDYVDNSWWFDPMDRRFVRAARLRMQLFEQRTVAVQQALAARGLFSGTADGTFAQSTVDGLKAVGITVAFSAPEDINQNVSSCVLYYLKPETGQTEYPDFCRNETPGLTLPALPKVSTPDSAHTNLISSDRAKDLKQIPPIQVPFKTMPSWEISGSNLRINAVSNLLVHSSVVEDLAFSSDAKRLAVADAVSEVAVWNTENVRLERSLPTQTKGGYSGVAFSPDGVTLAFADDGPLYAWNTETWTSKDWQDGELTSQKSARVVKYSPDGKTLAVAGCRPLDLLDGRTGQRTKTINVGNCVYDVAFSPNGSLLALALSERNAVKLFSPRTGKEVRFLGAHKGLPSKVAFSPDGQTVASVGQDDAVRLWPLDERPARTFTRQNKGAAPHFGAMSVSFAADGLSLVVGYDDGEVVIWDVKKGLPVAKARLSGTSADTVFGGALSSRIRARFSPVGSLLAVAAGNTVTLWSIR